jgi:hypothetical protein
MTELVTSGSVGGMASNGCFYPEEANSCALRQLSADLGGKIEKQEGADQSGCRDNQHSAEQVLE